MLVKICGTTRAEDARFAVEAGADLLGVIFVRRSKRLVTLDQARPIVRSLSGGVRPVGVFAGQTIGEVVEIARALALPLVQLHGDEPPEYLTELGRELPEAGFLRAWGFRDRGDLAEILHFIDHLAEPHRLMGVMLDGPWGGGQGRPFDWAELAEALAAHDCRPVRERLIVAGGLTAVNVAEAVRLLQPAGVDVATGVEAAPGIKDPAKVRAFIAAARSAADT